jgi:hypothetical protein
VGDFPARLLILCLALVASLVPTAGAAAQPGPLLGILAADTTLADEVAVALGSSEAVRIVERPQLDRALAEHGLSLAGLEASASVRTGRLLKADLLLIIERNSAKRQQLTLRTVRTEPGFLIETRFLTLPNPDQRAAAVEAATRMALDAAARYRDASGRATSISVPDLRATFSGADSRTVAEAFNATLLEALSSMPGLLVLERHQSEALAWENLTQGENLLLTRANHTLTGRIEHPPTEPGNLVVRAELRSEGQPPRPLLMEGRRDAPVALARAVAVEIARLLALDGPLPAPARSASGDTGSPAAEGASFTQNAREAEARHLDWRLVDRLATAGWFLGDRSDSATRLRALTLSRRAVGFGWFVAEPERGEPYNVDWIERIKAHNDAHPETLSQRLYHASEALDLLSAWEIWKRPEKANRGQRVEACRNLVAASQLLRAALFHPDWNVNRPEVAALRQSLFNASEALSQGTPSAQHAASSLLVRIAHAGLWVDSQQEVERVWRETLQEIPERLADGGLESREDIVGYAFAAIFGTRGGTSYSDILSSDRHLRGDPFQQPYPCRFIAATGEGSDAFAALLDRLSADLVSDANFALRAGALRFRLQAGLANPSDSETRKIGLAVLEELYLGDVRSSYRGHLERELTALFKPTAGKECGELLLRKFAKIQAKRTPGSRDGYLAFLKTALEEYRDPDLALRGSRMMLEWFPDIESLPQQWKTHRSLIPNLPKAALDNPEIVAICKRWDIPKPGPLHAKPAQLGGAYSLPGIPPRPALARVIDLGLADGSANWYPQSGNRVWFIEHPTRQLVGLGTPELKEMVRIPFPPPGSAEETLDIVHLLEIAAVSDRWVVLWLPGSYLPWRLLVLDLRTREWRRVSGLPPLVCAWNNFRPNLTILGDYLHSPYRDEGREDVTGQLRVHLPSGTPQILTESGPGTTGQLPAVGRSAEFHLLEDGRIQMFPRDDRPDQYLFHPDSGEWTKFGRGDRGAPPRPSPRSTPQPGVTSRASAERPMPGARPLLDQLFPAGATHILTLETPDGHRFLPIQSPVADIEAVPHPAGILLVSGPVVARGWAEWLGFVSSADFEAHSKFLP